MIIINNSNNEIINNNDSNKQFSIHFKEIDMFMKNGWLLMQYMFFFLNLIMC